MKSISIATATRTELVDITGLIKEVVKKNKWTEGVLYVYIPHTTAGVTINELSVA